MRIYRWEMRGNLDYPSRRGDTVLGAEGWWLLLSSETNRVKGEGDEVIRLLPPFLTLPLFCHYPCRATNDDRPCAYNNSKALRARTNLCLIISLPKPDSVLAFLIDDYGITTLPPTHQWTLCYVFMYREAEGESMHHFSDYNMSENKFTFLSKLSPLHFLWNFNLKGFLEGELQRGYLKYGFKFMLLDNYACQGLKAYY